MIDSKIKPQPGEGRGINTINQKGPGLQKDQVRTPTTEVLERDCGFDIKVWLVVGLWVFWVL